MPSFTIRLTSRFPELSEQAAARARLAVSKTALDIEAQAKSRAPVRSGFLKSSIAAKEQDGLHWRVDVQADYGAYVEFGTRFMGARPYFVPAVELVRPSFAAAMARIVGP